jgi:hypothetical protein
MTSTRFHDLFHLLEIRHSFLATKLFHHLDFMVPKAHFSALFHEPLHFSEIGFSIFSTTLFHRLVHHRYNPRLGTNPTPDPLPQHGYGDIDLDHATPEGRWTLLSLANREAMNGLPGGHR